MLAFSQFRGKEGISKTTVKTLLMEVLSVPTPISSTNYKALHEGLPTGYAWTRLLGVSFLSPSYISSAKPGLGQKARTLMGFGQRPIAGPELRFRERGSGADDGIGCSKASL